MVEQLSSPVLIFDDGVHDLLHLLGEGRGVWGEFLCRGTASFLGLLPVLVLVSHSAAAGARRRRTAVVIPVLLTLPGRLFVTHLLLDVLQIPLLDGLRRGEIITELNLSLNVLTRGYSAG